jgi:hypothetical protein
MAHDDLHVPARPGAKLREAGALLVGVFLICQLAARLILRVYFPELRAQGVSAVTLAVFVPIWSLVLVGALLWLAGLIRGKLRGGG